MDAMNQFLLPTENATAHAWAIEVGQYYILKGAAGREQVKSILLGVTIFFRENHTLRPLKSSSLSASCRLKCKRGVLKAFLGPVLSSMGISRTASEAVSSLRV
jgi:hypothetical protein